MIVVTGTREVQAASHATKAIPIVTIVAPDPVATGLGASLAHPGGNVTGLTFSATGIAGKYVELLHDAVPSAMRMAILASRPQASTVEKDLLDAARARGVVLLPIPLVKGVEDFDAFFARARREGAGGIIVTSDGVTNVHRQQVVDAALKHRMPTIYPVHEFVDRGGLLAYGPSFADLFRRAATFVDKVLKSISPILLARADQVLE